MNIILHKQIMNDFITEINKNKTGLILKGGTALYLCYGLDRFSTDIDLDGNTDITNLIEKICKRNDWEFFIKKNTETTQRFSIYYDKEKQGEFLKIEISHRKFNGLKKENKNINGVLTYTINDLFSMKLAAFMGRIKIRDLYDICFIYNKYKNELSKENINILTDYLNEKEDDYFEYLIKTQGDDFVIDLAHFEDLYLKMLLDLEKGNEKYKKYEM